MGCCFFFFNDTATTEIYTLSLHDALPISPPPIRLPGMTVAAATRATREEKDRLLADFERYCAIESVSLDERAMADAVATDLRALGLEVAEDGTGPETGSNAGNLDRKSTRLNSSHANISYA